MVQGTNYIKVDYVTIYFSYTGRERELSHHLVSINTVSESLLKIEMREKVQNRAAIADREFERYVWYNKTLQDVIVKSSNNTMLRVHNWQIHVDLDEYENNSIMVVYKIITPIQDYCFSSNPSRHVTSSPRLLKCTCDTTNRNFQKCKCATKQLYYHSRETCASFDYPCELWRSCTTDCNEYEPLSPEGSIQSPNWYIDSLNLGQRTSPLNNNGYVLDLISPEERAAEDAARATEGAARAAEGAARATEGAARAAEEAAPANLPDGLYVDTRNWD